jgi:uncharacterized PurR-regulated membrane protein YhhQ (DUF165 family)
VTLRRQSKHSELVPRVGDMCPTYDAKLHAIHKRRRPVRPKSLGLVALVLFIATVYVANWLVSHYGVVNVGFGLVAPAAVFSVGIAFTLRDAVHRLLGPWYVVAGILAGAALSYTISPAFATASAVAFLVSEAADLLVYTPLEKRSWIGAVTLSNTVGLLIDSWIFLTIAFGSLDFFWGQVVGKAWMTALTIALFALARGIKTLRPVTA